MREKTLQYYRQGYNCSQCLIKAAEYCYRIPVSKTNLNMCTGIANGFGVGGVCSLLVAGIMIFGLLFDDSTVKSLRIQFMTEFNEKYGSTSCAVLKQKRANGFHCEQLVGDTAEMIERIIDSAL